MLSQVSHGKCSFSHIHALQSVLYIYQNNGCCWLHGHTKQAMHRLCIILHIGIKAGKFQMIWCLTNDDPTRTSAWYVASPVRKKVDFTNVTFTMAWAGRTLDAKQHRVKTACYSVKVKYHTTTSRQAGNGALHISQWAACSIKRLLCSHQHFPYKS